MSKGSTKLWLGFAAGMAAGALIALKASDKRRMPNAKEWQQLLDIEYGQIEAAALMARVQQRYDDLVSLSGKFDSNALQGHLTENILPALALYQTWRVDGLDQETALEKVDALYEIQYKTGKKGLFILERLLRVLPGGFSTFKRLVARVVRTGFPAPGFELRFISDDDHHFGFDIERCFYQDVVTRFGAPELTPSFCKVDDYTMEALPEQIRWSRCSTLGLGASQCDFHWEYTPEGNIPVDQVGGGTPTL